MSLADPLVLTSDAVDVNYYRLGGIANQSTFASENNSATVVETLQVSHSITGKKTSTTVQNDRHTTTLRRVETDATTGAVAIAFVTVTVSVPRSSAIAANELDDLIDRGTDVWLDATIQAKLLRGES